MNQRRNSMNKKLVSILILGVISFMLALPVSASQNVSEGIQPRVQECGRCGKMSLHVVKCGSRTSTAEVDCGHGLPFGSDAVKKTYTIYQYITPAVKYRRFYLPKFPSAMLSSVDVAPLRRLLPPCR